MLEVGLHSLLAADAGLSALIAGKIYPIVVPSESTDLPCLTYQVVTADSEFSVDGKALLSSKRIQFSAIANSYLECKNVLAALALALDGFTGTLTDGTRILVALSTVEIDNFENDSKTYRSVADYEIEYSQP